MKLVSFMVLFTKKSVEAGYLTESDNLDVIIKETMPEDDEHSMNYRINVQCKLEFDVIEGFNITEDCSDLYFDESCCKFGPSLSKICRCEYIESGWSTALFPNCEWFDTGLCPEETTFPETSTELSTFPTETTTETSFSSTVNTPVSTSSTTASSTQPNNSNCPILTNPTNGAIYCNEQNTKCGVICDPGFVPWSLKFTSDPLPVFAECDTHSGEWSQPLTDECLPIDEVCSLDASMIDQSATIKIIKKEGGFNNETALEILNDNISNEDFSRSVSGSIKNIKIHILGGVVYTTSCKDGLTFKNTGKSKHREKCVCKFVGEGYKCVRSQYFDSDLGVCIDETNSSDFVDSLVDDLVNPTEVFDESEKLSISEMKKLLAIKRMKFSSFMGGLYDLFLM